MALVDLNFNPSSRQLRQFGAICVVALPALTWFWTRNPTNASWAAGLGIAVCLLSLVSPHLIKAVFVGLTIVTIPIGMIVGELTMLLIYFGVFLPMAIVFRIIGRDSLQRRSGVTKTSYWQKRTPVSSIRRYYQQF